MKLVIQRVGRAKVSTKDAIVGRIGKGLMVLVGFTDADTREIVDKVADKLLKLRVMSDDKDKMNLSIIDTKGDLLLVSQFTLYGNSNKGNRPSFIDAMLPDQAKKLFDYFVAKCRESGLKVETGNFGEYMMVELVNDGPVTIIIES